MVRNLFWSFSYSLLHHCEYNLLLNFKAVVSFIFIIIANLSVTLNVFQLSWIRCDLMEMDFIMSARASSLTRQLLPSKHSFFIRESRYLIGEVSYLTNFSLFWFLKHILVGFGIENLMEQQNMEPCTPCIYKFGIHHDIRLFWYLSLHNMIGYALISTILTSFSLSVCVCVLKMLCRSGVRHTNILLRGPILRTFGINYFTYGFPVSILHFFSFIELSSLVYWLCLQS